MEKALEGEFDFKYFDRGRWWYSEWEGHQRKVMTVQYWYGLYEIQWGYNYDFIPSWNQREKFDWHRTEKAFCLHVKDSWRGHVEDNTESISGLGKNNILYRNPRRCPKYRYELPENATNLNFALEFMEGVVKRNIPFMKEWFGRVKTLEDVLSALDRQIETEGTSSTWYWDAFYVKAFLYAKMREMDAAIAMMQKRFPYGEIPKKVLEKLYQTAEESGLDIR
ncbi:MAG: hypothetical protein NC092_03230 [Butyrivibrio sp.]|nr:hypothetical protein [Muribaculum sp.]MCM1551686.1 hypothetical protein [Butyrivibrio sp.]